MQDKGRNSQYKKSIAKAPRKREKILSLPTTIGPNRIMMTRVYQSLAYTTWHQSRVKDCNVGIGPRIHTWRDDGYWGCLGLFRVPYWPTQGVREGIEFVWSPLLLMFTLLTFPYCWVYKCICIPSFFEQLLGWDPSSFNWNILTTWPASTLLPSLFHFLLLPFIYSPYFGFILS